MSYVTGISGNVISAASAGYAPTNGADVSAIASAYATGGVDSATVSAIASAYVESGVSSKQDTLTFGYDDSTISSINGSALAGGGGGGTGDYVEKSAMDVAIGSGNDVSSTAFAQGADNVTSGISVAFGVNNVATTSAMAAGKACSAVNKALAVGVSSTAKANALAVGNKAKADNMGLAVGDRCSASTRGLAFGYYASAYIDSVAAGEFCSAKNTAVAFGKYNLHVDGDTSTGESAAFVIGDGTTLTARHDLMLVTKDGEITMYSSTADTVGTGIMSSIRAISAAATGGGVDSATVSAIASSYAESAASSKLDTTAFNSGDFYTTSNPSGFVDSAYVESAVSSKADSSALSSYVPYSSLEYNTASAISGINGSALAAGSTYSAGEGIDITDDVISVEAPVDIVAGPGIVIDNPDGNTLRVSTDENYKTLLYTASAYSSTLELSESPSNFEYLELEMVNNNGTTLYPHQICRITIPENEFGVAYRTVTYQNINFPVSDWFYAGSISGTTISITRRQMFWHTLSGNEGGVNQGADIYPAKIYGVHRINGGN